MRFEYSRNTTISKRFEHVDRHEHTLNEIWVHKLYQWYVL